MKEPCPHCNDTREIKGDACKRCARAAEIDYQTGKDPGFNERAAAKMKLMMAGK